MVIPAEFVFFSSLISRTLYPKLVCRPITYFRTGSEF